ncbi:hypothetical protein, partial [Thiolapillus sp.]|uniref:hypothetical protein n=1 Tax=Thiolapillus sp. TaxID=2017437 RepID=UPI0025D6A0F6
MAGPDDRASVAVSDCREHGLAALLSPKPEGCYPPVGGHYRLMGPVGGDGGYVEAPSKKLMII